MKMRNIPTYNFHKTKYGSELLIDVVGLKYVKRYLPARSLHTLTYYDITLITEGAGLFRIDDVDQHASAGEILFSLPYQPREWDTQNILDGYALIFEAEFLLSFFNDPHFLDRISYFRKDRNCNRLMLPPAAFDRIQTLVAQIKQEIDTCTIKNKHILRALLYQTLMYLDRAFVEQNRPPRNPENRTRADSFLQLVHADFQTSHAVRYYADKLHLTPNYLNELVKKQTGMSAKRIIRNKLITESKKYLLYSDLTVAEISERLSFETPSYFIRFFHKHTGCTPLQFRKDEKP